MMRWVELCGWYWAGCDGQCAVFKYGVVEYDTVVADGFGVAE